MRTRFCLLLGGLLATGASHAQAPVRASKPVPDAPSDDQTFRKEIVFGVNLNTQGGLIGGAVFRSSRVLNNRWLRFWSLEGVAFKNPKEERYVNTATSGTFVLYKTNHALSLRPSFGLQRILFRKAPDAGVQVNGLLSAGPSLGLLMPYYVQYDHTAVGSQTFRATDDIRDEQFDPAKHNPNYIVDSAPLFSGIGETKLVPGFHLRGGLSFEYGRYRDAVAGVEAGFLLDAYTKRLIILNPGSQGDVNQLNHSFFPSVYLTLYLGHRS